MSEEHSYSLPHYRHILKKAKDLGYRLPRVEEVAFGLPHDRFFLIRHDVDICPWAALEMARLEVEEGVRTTYYYRFHAETYNLMAESVLQTLREVGDLGHELGLHYEPGFFLDQGRDPVEGVRRDLRLFEEILGRKTKTIAQHQPATGPVLAEISKDHRDAYQPELVRQIRYFGDSGFHWREGCICTKLGLYDQIHTLIHPHSWTIWDKPWQDVLRAHASALGERLGLEMEAYIAHVEDYLSKRPALDREREERYKQ